jgi:hypothetical protein
MKVKEYTLLSDLVDEGLRGFLWNDVELHESDEPMESRVEHLVDKGNTRIMNAICERFTFDNENE